MSDKSTLAMDSRAVRLDGSRLRHSLGSGIGGLEQLRPPAAAALVLFALALLTLAAVAIDVLTGVSVAAFGWLYLLVILPVTLRWGRIAGLATSAAALLLLLTFLTEPRGLPYTRSGVDLIRLFFSMGGLALAVFLVDQLNRRIVSTDHLLAVLAESAGDVVMTAAPDATILGWSAGAEQLYGFTAEDAVGKNSGLLFPAERRGEWDEIVKRLQLGERNVQVDTVQITRDGGTIDVTLNVTAARDTSGRVTALSAVARDVTALRRVESALRENADRLTEALEGIGHGLVVLNESGGVVAVNRAAEALLGGSLEVEGKRFLQLFSDRFTLQPSLKWDDIRRAEVSRFLAVDIRRTPLSLRVELTPLSGRDALLGPLFVATLRDATVEVETAYQEMLHSGAGEPSRTLPATGWPPVAPPAFLDDPTQTAEVGAPALTAREAEVLTLIAQGQSNQGIADSLGITVNTVERHIANLYRKLQIRSRAQATAYVLQHGVGQPTNGFH